MITTSNGIHVIRYVHKDGGLVDIDELTPEDRLEAAKQIKLTWLNGLFQGRAVFEIGKENRS